MSFRLKTVIGIGLIEIFLIGLLIVSGMHYIRTSNEQQVLDRAESTTRLAATMTADAVISMDVATLDSLAEQILLSPEILYVRIRSQNGSILAHGGDPQLLEMRFAQDYSIDDARGDGRLDVSKPITVAGTQLGSIEIGVSIDEIDVILTRASKWLLSIGAVEVLLVLVFGYFLGLLLTRRLDIVRDAASEVANGRFGYQIEIHGKDEITETAISFNNMSAALLEFARKAEEQTRKAKERMDIAETVLHDAVESMPDSVIVTDANDNIISTNIAFTQMFPHAVKQLTAHGSYKELNAVMETAVESAKDIEIPSTSLDMSAHTRELRLSEGRVFIEKINPTSKGGVVIVHVDVSELYDAVENTRRLERELLQSQKLESLGTLAGGIAHEINTPIQYIGDNLRFLDSGIENLIAHAEVLEELYRSRGSGDTAAEIDNARRQHDTDFIKEELPLAGKQALEGVAQVARIVSAMKNFAHPGTEEATPFDINDAISNTITICRNEWKSVAAMDLDLAAGLPKVSGFQGPFSQVLLNIVVNAAQAIAESGKPFDEARIAISTGGTADKVEISVTDNGPGMPAHIRERIFEPFFTTKDVGKGSGQGLAIAHDIIARKHGGTIDVDSTPGEGTTFRLVLPMEAPVRQAAA